MIDSSSAPAARPPATLSLLAALVRFRPRQCAGVMALSLLSSAVGIAVLYSVNRLLVLAQGEGLAPDALGAPLALFLLMLLAWLAGSTLSQWTLTRLGHRFVMDLRLRLVRDMLHTDLQRLQQIGPAPLLASLTGDLQHITTAVVRLPELLQGGLFLLGALGYLLWLSPLLTALTLLWIGATLVGGAWAVKRVYAHLDHLRDHEARLLGQYDTLIRGARELALNRQRAARWYQRALLPQAEGYREHIVRADSFHFLAHHWTSAMLLGAVGAVYFCALSVQWISVGVATSVALTVLFIRTPLISAVGALSTLQAAQVALARIRSLALQGEGAALQSPGPMPASDWQRLALQRVGFRHPQREGAPGFALSEVSLTLERGQICFCVGDNGSGKSTLALLLCGLLMPHSGQILLDGQAITRERLPQYRALFSAVFSDVHLFDQLLGPRGDSAAPERVQEWLEALRLQDKVDCSGGTVASLALSQGQRKRLALLLALLEERPLIVLDEWAADQDPHFRYVFYHQLLPLMRQRGWTVFAICHDDAYFGQADRLFEMRQGVLTELHGAARERASQGAIAHLQAPLAPAP